MGTWGWSSACDSGQTRDEGGRGCGRGCGWGLGGGVVYAIVDKLRMEVGGAMGEDLGRVVHVIENKITSRWIWVL